MMNKSSARKQIESFQEILSDNLVITEYFRSFWPDWYGEIIF